MVFDTSDDRFGSYAKRVSESAKYKQQAPQRAWDKLESLTNQAVSGPLDASQEQEFKQARRDWNRQYKNTPVGIMASGVDLGADPFGAQDLYHDMSSLMYHDQPKMYDRMYPLNPGKLISGLAENIGPMGWLNKILPKRERKVPANVLAMRERFPGIKTNEITSEVMDNIIPKGGISPLVPDHIKNSTLGAINKVVDEGEGIFSGTGQSALEESDLEKYIPPISDRVLAEWFLAVKPEMNLTVEKTEQLIRDLEPAAKKFFIEQYEKSQ